jgi:hypothetical protein
MLYRIAWKSLTTDYQACGEYCLYKTDAEDYVSHLNEKYKNEIFHWIEEHPTLGKKRVRENNAKEEESSV